VWSTNSALASSSSSDSLAWSLKDYKEVHTEDTDAWVVFDAQIDVLHDTETEAASAGEVTLLQLVLLDLKARLEDLLGFWASDGNSAGDLLISSDTEGSHGESGLAEDWALAGQLLEDLGGSSEPITTLTNANVQAELGDSDVFHAIGLFGSHFLMIYKPNAHENVQVKHCRLKKFNDFSFFELFFRQKRTRDPTPSRHMTSFFFCCSGTTRQ